MTYLESFSLKGKTAVITGGAGILGEHFCKGLAEAGASVCILDQNEKAAKDLASALQDQYRVKSLGLFCDVSDKKSVESSVAAAVEKLGPIHILHNNAATKTENLEEFFASFEDYSIDTWREVMGVNIDGMFLMAQACGRQMIQSKIKGSIIQTSSIYGSLAPDQRIYKDSQYMNRTINTPAVYSVSKAAVVGLTRHLATYWAPHGIRVNCLTPGGAESGQNPTFSKNYSERVPLGRMAQPQEMVGALIYLASDASSYVTGQNFFVDGGLSAW
jgi:NAD(P)-dependent dehydrogenase (short-subunit alcohol dehydrogenase family)